MQKAMFPISKTWVSQAMNVGSHIDTFAIDFGILSPYNVTELTAPFDGVVVYVDSQANGGGIAFQSLNKVKYVDGTEDYMTLWTGHDNKPPKLGTSFKQGEVYSHMGTAGGVSKHCHLEVQKGKFKMATKVTSVGSYKFENTIEPYKALFLKEGDLIKYSPYTWKVAPVTVGTPVERDVYVDQIEVISTILNARNTPSLKGTRLGYITPGIYNIIGTTQADGYTWYEVEKDLWIAYNEEWETLLPKEDSEVDKLRKEIEKLKKENSDMKDRLNQIHTLSS